METKIKQLIKKVLNEGIEYTEPELSSCDCSKQIKNASIQLAITKEEIKKNPNISSDEILKMLSKIEFYLSTTINEGEDDDSEDEPKSTGGGDAGQNLKKETDLVLTPKSSDIDTVVSALENMDNYGMYLSNLRNTKAGLQKAIDDHFGPSTPMVKRGLEKKRGKPFAVKSKQAIDDFIKSFSKNTNILSYNVEGNTVRFPSGENATPATLKNIIKTVMDKAGIEYKLDSKENLAEQFKKAKKIQKIIKEALQEKEQIPGGLAKGKTLQQIADHHKVALLNIQSQLATGIKVEKEHTNNFNVAKEIAMDHLWEDPNYYTKLNKMEKSDLKEDESLFKITPDLAFKIYNILKTEVPKFTDKFPLQSQFFSFINSKL